MTELKSLLACSWLVAAFAALAVVDDLIRKWLGGGDGAPDLFGSLGLIAAAAALARTHRLLAAHAAELAALRAAARPRG